VEWNCGIWVNVIVICDAAADGVGLKGNVNGCVLEEEE
jgi:hypothetical protein